MKGNIILKSSKNLLPNIFIQRIAGINDKNKEFIDDFRVASITLARQSLIK